MTPYYDEGGITLYHGDCRAVLPGLSFDVVVTDPPYGMNYESGWSGAVVANDHSLAARDAMLALAGDGPALLFGRWSEPKPPGTRITLTWDKGDWPGMGDLGMPWGPSVEEVYVLGRGFIGKRGGSVIRVPRVGATGMLHPTEKPVSLMEKLVAACPAAWIVLDPFAGSGTTLVAAKNLGRRAIGIEIEERYCEVAAKRLAQGVLDFGAATAT